VEPRITQGGPVLQGNARAVIDGISYERGEVFHAYDEWIWPVHGEVSERQIREAIENLHRHLTQENVSAFQAGLPWFLEQLGIVAESAKELSIEELYEQLTPGLLFGLMSRNWESIHENSSHLGWAFLFFAYRLFEKDALAHGIPEEEVQRRYGEPPWILLNEILEASELPFRTVFPDLPFRAVFPDRSVRPSSLVYDSTFKLRLQDVELGVEVPY
jgi:hypothetical protein